LRSGQKWEREQEEREEEEEDINVRKKPVGQGGD